MKKKTYHPKGFTIISLANCKYLVPSNSFNPISGSYDTYYEEIYDGRGIFVYWKRAKGYIIINPSYIITSKTC